MRTERRQNARRKKIRRELRYGEHELLHIGFASTLPVVECGELPRCSFNRCR
jgi:hypothetical protein